MTEHLNIGILGATGNVGKECIALLESWDTNKLPIKELRLFGTERSAGKIIKFRGQDITVQNTTIDNCKGLDLVLSMANGDVSANLVPLLLKENIKLVIDTDSYYRMDKNIPLVIAGVNDNTIQDHTGIIAGSNCTTAQLIPPLKVLDSKYGLKRIVVNTYQAISGAGKAQIDQLFGELKEIQSPDQVRRLNPDQLAFNLIPMISKLQDNGYSKEEMKVILESRKILNKPDLPITCTAVRVPVFNCHSESVNVELNNEFDLQELKDSLDSHEFIKVWHDNSEYPMPLDLSQTQPVHVGRIRRDPSKPNSIDMWIVADNLWIGAALNAIRIAESAYSSNNIFR